MRMPDPSLHAERRQQILEAAIRCFVRTGFHGTSMQAVCAEAGMSPGNLYRYFRSKTDIIAAIIDEERTKIVEGFAILEAADDFLGTFFQMLDQHLSMHGKRENVAMWSEVMSEICRSEEIAALYQSLERDLRGSMERALLKAIERGQIRPTLPADQVATLLISLGDGLCARAALDTTIDLMSLSCPVKMWTLTILNPVPDAASRPAALSELA